MSRRRSWAWRVARPNTDGRFTFLEADSLETLQFGLIRGRDQIAEVVKTFFWMWPSARLTHTMNLRFTERPVVTNTEGYRRTGLSPRWTDCWTPAFAAAERTPSLILDELAP
jgi:hypothetical protein